MGLPFQEFFLIACQEPLRRLTALLIHAVAPPQTEEEVLFWVSMQLPGTKVTAESSSSFAQAQGSAVEPQLRMPDGIPICDFSEMPWAYPSMPSPPPQAIISK